MESQDRGIHYKKIYSLGSRGATDDVACASGRAGAIEEWRNDILFNGSRRWPAYITLIGTRDNHWLKRE